VIRRVTRWGLPLAALVVSSAASARKVEAVPYPFVDAWNAALRFVVVDEAYAVTDRDADAGYLVFKFVPPGAKREERGSIELVRQGDQTDVIVSLPGLPSHHEGALLQRLLEKMKRELRAKPAPARPAPASRAKPDAGAE
jgi:hypothetical protein